MSKSYKVVEALPADTCTMYHDSADIVIVGNGIAGLTAALEARRLAPEARIVIITEQSHPTINTPTLKQFAVGKLAREQLLAYPAGTEQARRIHVINQRIEKIKAQGKFVCLSNGQEFGYDSLLLATGSTPLGLPEYLPGRDFDGVLTPHRLSNYLDLRRRLREVKEAAVIGGGIHAIETVMSLLHHGIRIHWFIRGKTFFPRMLDCAASAMVLESSRRAGARVYTETEVVGIVGKVGAVAGVVTNDGELIACQMVLACTGTVPLTMLAESCDARIAHKHGIIVDDQLRTSIHDIYAAGDVAALENPQTGVYERRAHWHAATLQGRVAAAIITGHDELAIRFGVPWHAADLGGLSMLTVGDPLGETEAVECLTSSSKGHYRRISVTDDRLIGYLSLGPTQPDSLAIKRIIDEELPVGKIKKALLKGDFDARQYFSQQLTGAIHTMVITGKLAVANPLTHVLPGAQSARNTEPLLPALIADRKNHDPGDAVPFQEAVVNKGSNEAPVQIYEAEQFEEVKVPEIHSAPEKVFPVISSFKSLMSKHLEPTRWIVPEILPESLIALAGNQRIGKSWLDLALGLGVACGGIVLGSMKARQGNVLYLALEDSEHRLQSRLGKLLLPGASLPDGFEYATSWPRMDRDGVTALEAWVASHPNARLVIIDPWIKVKPLARQQPDAASYDRDYEAFTRLKQLANTYHLCILLQFNFYKAAAHSFEEAHHAMTAISACADGFLTLKRVPGQHYATLYGKGREYSQDLELTLVFNDGIWKTSEKNLAHIHALSKERRAIIDTLNESDKPMRPKAIALTLGKPGGTIRKMLHEMKASDLIKTTDEGYLSLIPTDVDMLTTGNGENTSNGGNHNEDITVNGHREFAKSY